MFTGQQTSVRFFRTGQRISQQAGGFGRWLFIAPGLVLILFGVAILLWPELRSLHRHRLQHHRLGLAPLPAAAKHRSPLGNHRRVLKTATFSSRCSVVSSPYRELTTHH